MKVKRQSRDTEAKYLSADDVRALQRVFFSRRRPVDGRYAGRHATTQRGHSSEFSDYRPYIAGDEVGDIDWQAYGRSDKLFIKLFEHESDMNVQLLVDASASMAYRGAIDREGPRKYDAACRIAAAIAFLTIRQQDRVALAFAQEGLTGFRPPNSTFAHLAGMLTQMERMAVRSEGMMATALEGLMLVASRRMLLIVLSDFLDDRERILNALSVLRRRGAEVILFQTLHPDEISLPDVGEAIFRDSESGQSLRLSVPDARAAYADHMRQFLNSWRASCLARSMDHAVVRTDMDHRQALSSYLFQRSSVR